MSPPKNKPDNNETPEQKARRLALGLLARREHSFGELERKLLQRGLANDVVELQLGQLVEEGLLSDERFAEQFVRQRVERGQGPVKIRAEMQQRGVDAELIDIQLEAHDDEWPRLAENARNKRFGEEIPAEYEERARQARFLQQRGFGMEQIRRVLKGDIAED
ncbi:MAG: regulatory protein RecX [Gammaproteobacteria bacterium]|nr:regulatory protein RecX [Gammaproteobacteria bacterium]